MFFKRAKNKTKEEIEEIIWNEQSDIGYVDDAIWDRQSQFLGKQADKYLIPRLEFAPSGGAWEQSKVSGRWRLKKEALVDLTDIHWTPGGGGPLRVA